MRNLNSKPVRELGVADEPKHLLSQLSNIEGTCALMTLEEAKINEADVSSPWEPTDTPSWVKLCSGRWRKRSSARALSLLCWCLLRWDRKGIESEAQIFENAIRQHLNLILGAY